MSLSVTPLANLPFGFGNAIDRHLRGSAPVPPSLALPSPTLESVSSMAQGSMAFQELPSDLVDRIVEYNLAIGNPTGAKRAQALGTPGHRVVIGGQQPGLMGGPLMILAKIAGTAHLARFVEEHLQIPVIPIFWNHSEDHDLDEVNRYVFADGRLARLDYHHGGKPLETLTLDQPTLDSRFFMPAEFRPELGERHAAWASRSLAQLMPDFAVVHVEPFLVRPWLGGFFQDVVMKAGECTGALEVAQRRLLAGGFSEQIGPDQRSLLFRLAPDGQRRRIDRTGTTWSTATESWTTAELAEQVREEPQGFSCSVLTRAAAQQRVFPVVAHVNGPGESAYFAQLAELFQALRVPFPVAWPRPTLTVLNPGNEARRRGLGLTLDQLLGDPENWPDPNLPPAAAEPFAESRARLKDLIARFSEVAPEEGLQRAVTSFEGRVTVALDRLQRSFERYHENHGSWTGRRARHALREWVRPRGGLQERMLHPVEVFGAQLQPNLGTVLSRLDCRHFGHWLVVLGENGL